MEYYVNHRSKLFLILKKTPTIESIVDVVEFLEGHPTSGK